MKIEKPFGQVGYEAYCAHTGGKSLITGSALPAWDDLMPHIREAWIAAAAAIAESVQRALEYVPPYER